MSSRVTLCLGSNCSSRLVEEAIEWLGTVLTDVRSSGLYSTPPLKGNGDSYFNAVVTGSTSNSLDECNATFKTYERECGRDERCREKGIVPIDIDIVIWNDKVIRERDYIQNYFRIGYTRLR